ncbi:MAG TPA: histidine phosphatase family protein [Gemmatales bacterium]|nr:histidine phosphatase family protein [Gemmatales bacterium]
MSNLYLVRHGQASFGSRDYDQLSPLGVTQSELLGQWLAGTGLKPGRVIIGTLRRHRQTADACLNKWLTVDDTLLTPIEDGAFNEFDHKEVLLRCHAEFAEPGYLERFLTGQADGRRAFQKVFAESVERWVAGQHPGDYVESWPEFRDRSVSGLMRAAETAPNSDVWIFTSGGPIAAITQHVLGVSDAKVLDLNWSVLNASVSQFTHRRRTALKQFNNVAHLTLPGRSELFTYR